MTPYLLLVLGLFLVLVEFYLPGAIMGILGGTLIVASLIVFVMQADYWWENLIFFPLALGSLFALIKFALWRIPRTKPGYSIYSADAQNGYQASSFDPKAIGKKGIVLTDLKPGGYILIDGEQHQALSEAGYVTKGHAVLVLRGEGESLVVKELKKEQPQ